MKNTTLIFASNNEHKLEEIRFIVGKKFTVLSLEDAGIDIEIPEPHDTIEANASEKSRTIYKVTEQNCFGDDTGLEVEALNGEPGVLSARYAGEQKDFNSNIEKLLSNLNGMENRSAQFKTIISLMWDDEEHLFEGIIKGNIIHEKKGTNGFGYDAVFIPEGSHKTFAEMQLNEKNLYSHRKKAMDKMMAFLNQQ